MTVELPAGVEEVETDCGARQEPFAAERRSVQAQELRKAEDLLTRLRQDDAVGVCPDAYGPTCSEVENMVLMRIPTNIIVQTIQNAGGCFSPKTISCLKQKGIPPAVIEAGRPAR
ncbi:MAG TPA: hypothetical protein DFR83_24275 [Deltaproteobacteria bacterium]|nr:hypothetical protein [Deltaproteobacteria bacterium]